MGARNKYDTQYKRELWVWEQEISMIPRTRESCGYESKKSKNNTHNRCI